VSNARSDAAGPAPRGTVVHRIVPRWMAPATERNGGSRDPDERRRGARGPGHQSAVTTRPPTRPHERRRSSGARDSDPSAVTLRPGPDAPRRAREFASSRLGGQIDDDRAADALLLVSELVTNAVLHAGLEERDWIELAVLLLPTVVRVEVADSGGGFDAGADELPPPERSDGRGLFLVRRLSDRCGVAPEGASRVWFELDR
jgi:anti-sigma regulatory factor (Ser/Thr protein kinase)